MADSDKTKLNMPDLDMSDFVIRDYSSASDLPSDLAEQTCDEMQVAINSHVPGQMTTSNIIISSVDSSSAQISQQTSALQNSAIAPTSFTSFPRLPSKLRKRIWRSYEPPPRVICFTRPAPQGVTKWSIHVHCKAALPVLLRTSHESRKAVMKNYRVVLKDSLVYFHPKSDIFYFDDFDTYDFYLRHYLNLSLVEKSEVENMVTLGEVAMRLRHMVIDNVYGKGSHPKFDKYTFWGGLRSVTFSEEVLQFLTKYKDRRYPGMAMEERWEAAWERTAGVTPAFLVISSMDMQDVKSGKCEEFLRLAEWQRERGEKVKLERKLEEAKREMMEISESDEDEV